MHQQETLMHSDALLGLPGLSGLRKLDELIRYWEARWYAF